MKIFMRKNILLCFCLFATMIVAAQKDPSDSLVAKKSYGKLTLEFASNSVYNGRKDSLVTPYLTPSIGYYDKSGFYIEGSISYLMHSGNGRIDVYSINAGYDFTIGNFEGEISGEKPFYNENSTNVKSEVKGTLSARAAYDFGFIEPFLEPGINFNKNSDITLAAGLEHEFNPDEGPFSITPSVLFNGSTLNFYQSYFNKRKFKNLRNNSTKVNASVKNASAFSLLDYEFSLQTQYTTGNFTFTFTPYYTIPVNPAEVTVVITPNIGPVRSKTFTEELSNTFYVSLGIDWKF